jgi:hypothetical protein
MSRPALPALDDADVAYVTRHFTTLAEVCSARVETPDQVRRHMAAGELPRPSYMLADGTEMVPPDYFDLVDAAGGIGRLPAWLADQLGRALISRELDASDERVAGEWDGYLAGEYGVCLRRVTPENIAEKARLMRIIEAAIERPRPDHPAWRRALREQVDRLDAILRDFAGSDRVRFGGPVSRDRLVTGVRARFAACWSEDAPRR